MMKTLSFSFQLSRQIGKFSNIVYINFISLSILDRDCNLRQVMHECQEDCTIEKYGKTLQPHSGRSAEERSVAETSSSSLKEMHMSSVLR